MNQALADLLQKEVAKLNPSPVIELYELDTTPCGPDGDHLFFHNGTGGFAVPVSFLGVSYTPMPIIVKGFELNGSGEPPRPSLSILNAGGFMSAAVLKMDDLIGAILTRRRTFARFLDGEPEAAPVQYPEDIFKIVQKTREDRMIVEFELGSGLDLDGIRFPTRMVVATYCQHVYRSSGCRFSGPYVVASTNQVPMPGVLKFRDRWENNVTYAPGETVLFNGDLYLCIIADGTTIIGDTTAPSNTDMWSRIQHYCGQYDPALTYEVNDVVYVQTKVVKQFYVALRAVPESVSPPNKVFWKLDTCTKSLQHCRWRFDPMMLNRSPLPFGGFPGTLSIPEI